MLKGMVACNLGDEARVLWSPHVPLASPPKAEGHPARARQVVFSEESRNRCAESRAPNPRRASDSARRARRTNSSLRGGTGSARRDEPGSHDALIESCDRPVESLGLTNRAELSDAHERAWPRYGTRMARSRAGRRTFWSRVYAQEVSAGSWATGLDTRFGEISSR